MATTEPPAQAIDLERYPVHDLEAPVGRALVLRCRAELAGLGACDLPGFLRREAVETIVEGIFRQDDELGALNVMFYEPGDELGWHFDNADFAVTLMLQAPATGGVFEYVPMLRSADDPNPEGVRALLEGDRSRVRTLSPDAGTLALFRGHFSPHRVTPVEGSIPRINAVLSYAQTPGARLTASARRIFFGR